MIRLNVLKEPLVSCCNQPKTGYFRDGFCRTDDHDFGRHVLCSIVTEKFLAFTLNQGNDLITPRPEFSFSGLRPGNRWCLCALRWKEAWAASCAPPVDLQATDIKALDYIPIENLKELAIEK